MKKLLLLLLVSYTIANATSFMKNGELELVDDKEFIIRCIEGYKWIQFIERGARRGYLYFPSGNPQQMFEKRNDKSVPIECDK